MNIEERMYSVTMTEDELKLFSEFLNEFNLSEERIYSDSDPLREELKEEIKNELRTEAKNKLKKRRRIVGATAVGVVAAEKGAPHLAKSVGDKLGNYAAKNARRYERASQILSPESMSKVKGVKLNDAAKKTSEALIKFSKKRLH